MLPDHAQLLANAVDWACGGERPLYVDGAGYLDCKAYRRGARVIVHIVNLSGLNKRGYAEEALPVRPVTVRVKMDCPSATATLRVAGQDVTITMANGCARVRIDKIAEHEVVVLQPD